MYGIDPFLMIKLSELISCSLDAAYRSAEIIRKVRSSDDIHLRFKHGVEPVTAADVASEKTIKSLLLSQWFDESTTSFIMYS